MQICEIYMVIILLNIWVMEPLTFPNGAARFEK